MLRCLSVILFLCVSQMASAQVAFVRKHFVEVGTGTQPSKEEVARFPFYLTLPADFVSLKSDVPGVGMLIGKKEEVDVILATRKPSPIEVGIFRVTISMNAAFDIAKGRFSDEDTSPETKEKMAAAGVIVVRQQRVDTNGLPMLETVVDTPVRKGRTLHIAIPNSGGRVVVIAYYESAKNAQLDSEIWNKFIAGLRNES